MSETVSHAVEATITDWLERNPTEQHPDHSAMLRAEISKALPHGWSIEKLWAIGRTKIGVTLRPPVLTVIREEGKEFAALQSGEEYEAGVDRVMRQLYESRSMSPQPMTDERWDRVKGRFKSTMRVLREDAIAMIESGEIEL